MNDAENTIDVEQVIREYLPNVVHLSLATSNNNVPWVCEVHYAYDDTLNLYFRSLASRRHSQEILQNPRVAGNIVKQHTLDDEAVGIYFEGTAHMLETDEEMTSVVTWFNKCLGKENNIVEEAKRDDGHKMYKITVENWYVFGRFGLPRGKKYQLPWNKIQIST